MMRKIGLLIGLVLGAAFAAYFIVGVHYNIYRDCKEQGWKGLFSEFGDVMQFGLAWPIHFTVSTLSWPMRAISSAEEPEAVEPQELGVPTDRPLCKDFVSKLDGLAKLDGQAIANFDCLSAVGFASVALAFGDPPDGLVVGDVRPVIDGLTQDQVASLISGMSTVAESYCSLSNILYESFAQGLTTNAMVLESRDDFLRKAQATTQAVNAGLHPIFRGILDNLVDALSLLLPEQSRAASLTLSQRQEWLTIIDGYRQWIQRAFEVCDSLGLPIAKSGSCILASKIVADAQAFGENPLELLANSVLSGSTEPGRLLKPCERLWYVVYASAFTGPDFNTSNVDDALALCRDSGLIAEVNLRSLTTAKKREVLQFMLDTRLANLGQRFMCLRLANMVTARSLADQQTFAPLLQVCDSGRNDAKSTKAVLEAFMTIAMPSTDDAVLPSRTAASMGISIAQHVPARPSNQRMKPMNPLVRRVLRPADLDRRAPSGH